MSQVCERMLVVSSSRQQEIINISKKLMKQDLKEQHTKSIKQKFSSLSNSVRLTNP